MKLQSRSAGNRLVVELDLARLDSSVAGEFREALTATFDHGERNLILDLSKVAFVDSTGLGAIVGVFKHVGNNGSLVLAGMQQPVARLFQLTRMNRVFDIYSDAESAISGINRMTALHK